MLTVRLARASWSTPSTSTSRVAHIHTSSPIRASPRRGPVSAKAKAARHAEQERLAALSRPHTILGNKPGDEAKWKNSDLARILVTEEEILAKPAPPLATTSSTKVEQPVISNFGVGPRERELLFETLPALSTEAVLLREQRRMNPVATVLNQKEAASSAVERLKSSMLSRVIDLRNANAGGIAYENRRRCIVEFSDCNPEDTGRPEVQAAILTMRIRTIWDHLNKFKKDVVSRRSLRLLVHKRAKILRYLKRVDRDRYERVLERLGLEAGSVEGELVV